LMPLKFHIPPNTVITRSPSTLENPLQFHTPPNTVITRSPSTLENPLQFQILPNTVITRSPSTLDSSGRAAQREWSLRVYAYMHAEIRNHIHLRTIRIWSRTTGTMRSSARVDVASHANRFRSTSTTFDHGSTNDKSFAAKYCSSQSNGPNKRHRNRVAGSPRAPEICPDGRTDCGTK